MITYRANKTSTTYAAYRGEVRVGYVVLHASGMWGWELHLLRPSGGHHVGMVDSVEAARAALESAFREWMVHARLQEMKS